MRRSLALVVPIFMALLSCSRGGGNNVLETPPASVSGVWSTVANNAGSAILTGCTGDLTSFNGLTVAGIASAAYCVHSGPIVTSESGTSYTHLARTYACDTGDFGSDAGGGTITGQSLSGQMDTISSYYGTAGSEFVTGTALAANTVALSNYRIAISGNVNGSCNISPSLSITVTILQPLEGTTLQAQHAREAFSLTRMLNDHYLKHR